MTRRHSSRSRRRVNLRGIERLLFISGAVLYVVGFFGGVGLLAMPLRTAVWLLILSGGMLLAVLFGLLL